MIAKSMDFCQLYMLLIVIVCVEVPSKGYTKQICHTFSQDGNGQDECPKGACCKQTECDKEGKGMKCQFSNCPECSKKFFFHILIVLTI